MTQNTDAILHDLLCNLGTHIRASVMAERSAEIEELARVSKVSAADTIYHIDKICEDAILQWFKDNWPSQYPVRIVMEGIDDDEPVIFPTNIPVEEAQYRVIIDPIDGTRNLMYDKRAGWALIGLARTAQGIPSLEDIEIAIATELPTSRQYIAYQCSAFRGADGKIVKRDVSTNVLTQEKIPAVLRPSRATDLLHGFASVAKYFTIGKAAIASFEEELLNAVVSEEKLRDALVFDDQYISSGGQLFELTSGHHRFVLDIRPIVYAKLGIAQTLCCHPYDLCALMLARAHGVIVETPYGQRFDQVPLDTTTPVSWVGYANESLADTIRPHLKRIIQKHFG